MTEILTESFCERCGTRYTFESARPRTRLKGVRVLSRGLKNFVMSDGTSMDEAMAAARNETDRELTNHQLDAFHATFNFCMTCRQYTCPNCWNEAEARCLTCAPHLGHDVMPAPFPDLATNGQLVADPFPVNGANGSNGHGFPLADVPPVEADAGGPEDDGYNIDFAARLEALTVTKAAVDAVAPAEAEAEAVTPVEAVAEVEAPVEEPTGEVEAVAEFEAPIEAPAIEPVAEVEAQAIEAVAEVEAPVEAQAIEAVAEVEAPVEAQAIEAVAEPEAPVEAPAVEAVAEFEAPLEASVEPEAVAEMPVEPIAAVEAAPDLDEHRDGVERAATLAAAAFALEAASTDEQAADQSIEQKTAAQTGSLLQRFRPGESLDAELAAYERETVPAASDATPVEPEIVTSAEPAPVAEPAIAAEPDIAAQPILATEPEPQTLVEAAPVVEDVVAQPTWRMVAPDTTPEPSGGQTIPAAAAANPSAEPQWPDRPEWLGPTPATGLPFLNRPATPQGGLEALWAESTIEVVAPLTRGPAPAGVQPCVSCGLSLSATARFCRRCGTSQPR